MKKSFLFFWALIGFMVSCGVADETIDTERETVELTFKVNYEGKKEIKQVRGAVFDYDVAVKDDNPDGPPYSTAVFPEEHLTEGGVDFSAGVEMKLRGIKGKKYLVVIYGDVNSNDGKFKVNDIDPVYYLKDFILTDSKKFDILLKDKDVGECSKDNPNGFCDAGKVCVDGECRGDITCEPECEGKECGSDGCGGSCGTCSEDFICSEENTCVSDAVIGYEIKVRVFYKGNKEIKRLGIAGYYDDSYSGMPSYVQFVDSEEENIEFPYEFSFNPTKDGVLGNIENDFNGDFYVWLYGDVDGSGFKPEEDDPQVKFKVKLPISNEINEVEIR